MLVNPFDPFKKKRGMGAANRKRSANFLFHSDSFVCSPEGSCILAKHRSVHTGASPGNEHASVTFTAPLVAIAFLAACDACRKALPGFQPQ